MNESVTVPVKSAWASKINWTQIVAAGAAVGAVFGIDVDPKVQTDLLLGITAIQTVATIVIRTYFSKAVVAASI